MTNIKEIPLITGRSYHTGDTAAYRRFPESAWGNYVFIYNQYDNFSIGEMASGLIAKVMLTKLPHNHRCECDNCCAKST